jgi:hypothetical protein
MKNRRSSSSTPPLPPNMYSRLLVIPLWNGGSGIAYPPCSSPTCVGRQRGRKGGLCPGLGVTRWVYTALRRGMVRVWVTRTYTRAHVALSGCLRVASPTRRVEAEGVRPLQRCFQRLPSALGV